MTSHVRYDLEVILEDREGKLARFTYANFSVSSPKTNFKLSISGSYKGPVGGEYGVKT